MTNQTNRQLRAEQARSLAKKRKKITITRLTGSGPGTIQANN